MVIFHVFGIIFKIISIDAGHIIFLHSSSDESFSVDYFPSPKCDQMGLFGDKIAQFLNSMRIHTVGCACIKIVPLKLARKTAHATMFIQKIFGNCYGLVNTLCTYILIIERSTDNILSNMAIGFRLWKLLSKYTEETPTFSGLLELKANVITLFSSLLFYNVEGL